MYKRLVYWELELSETDSNMDEMLGMQKTEANLAFAKFIHKHYEEWITHPEDRPLMSPDIFKTKIFPLLNQGEKVFLIVLDNFRYDQWRTLSTELADAFLIDEDIYCSILPTATQYARNAIFSGLMPDKIAQMYPDLWVDEDEEEGKNLNEGPLIQTQLDRYRRKNTFSYHKINDSTTADKLIGQFKQLEKYDLNVIVYRHAFPCSYGIENGARTGFQRGSLSQHHPKLVPAFCRERPVQGPGRKRLQNHRHDRPRQYPREVTGQSHRGQEHEHELALQTGEKSEIQPQRSL